MVKGNLAEYKNKWDLTPKKLIIILIFVLAFSRVLITEAKAVWLIVDPFDFRNVWPLKMNMLLHEISFSIIFSIYAAVLFIWYTLAENIYMRSKKHGTGLPKWILAAKHFGFPKAVIFYSTQIVSSSLKNFKKKEFLDFMLVTQYLVAGFFFFLFLEFCYMSWFLSSTLNKERKDLKVKEEANREAAKVKKNKRPNKNRRKTTIGGPTIHKMEQRHTIEEESTPNNNSHGLSGQSMQRDESRRASINDIPTAFRRKLHNRVTHIKSKRDIREHDKEQLEIKYQQKLGRISSNFVKIDLLDDDDDDVNNLIVAEEPAVLQRARRLSEDDEHRGDRPAIMLLPEIGPNLKHINQDRSGSNSDKNRFQKAENKKADSGRKSRSSKKSEQSEDEAPRSRIEQYSDGEIEIEVHMKENNNAHSALSYRSSVRESQDLPDHRHLSKEDKFWREAKGSDSFNPTRVTFGFETQTAHKRTERTKYKYIVSKVARQKMGTLSCMRDDTTVFWSVMDTMGSPENKYGTTRLFKNKAEFLSHNWKYLENHSFFVNSIFDLYQLDLNNQDLEFREDLYKDDRTVFRRVYFVADIDLQNDVACAFTSPLLLHSLCLDLH